MEKKNAPSLPLVEKVLPGFPAVLLFLWTIFCSLTTGKLASLTVHVGVFFWQITMMFYENYKIVWR